MIEARLARWLPWIVGIALGACSNSVEVDKTLLSGPLPYRGLSLSGAEWSRNPDGTGGGAFGTAYMYPDPTYASGYNSADYYISKGMTTFRLPFRWESLQPNRHQPFDSAELTRLRTTVDHLLAKGAAVILDPHNYARYGTSVIGSASVPNSDFADLWSRLATEFKGNPNVLFGLVNEPYDIPTEQWVSAANAAIAAVRATGATNTILVAGNQWDSAMNWNASFYGTPNAVALLQITDPGDNIVFEAHQYLDAGTGGSDPACVSATIGSERVKPFTDWLRANGKKGLLGEFGGGTSPTCLAAMDDLLRHIEANQDVYVGWEYWAGGPWWGSSWYSVEPSGSTNKPQMDVLEKHLGASVTPPTTTTTTCAGGTTYEAEAMSHSTGGATSGGWNLWSNGYVAKSHTFAAGATTIDVLAAGTSAAGGWPQMTVSVGGTAIGSVTVNSKSYTSYSFPYTATAGAQEIRVSFTNDLYTSSEDRNLLVDKVIVGCAASGDVCAGATGLGISTPLALDKTTVAQGQALGGKVTYRNCSTAPLALQQIVIAARPPGGTHAGGPYLDLTPAQSATTVAVGGTITVSASRTFSSTDPTGTWVSYATYQDSTGSWHDGPDVSFAVTQSGGGASGGGGGGGGGGSSVPPNPISFTKGQPFTLNSGTTNYAYVPSSYDSTHQTPMTLFVWLHGCGGYSSGDIWVVSPGGSQNWISLAPGGAEGGCWNLSTQPSVVMAAIADVRSHFNINPKKIILGGYSSGGELTYETAFHNASTFAGVLVANSAPFTESSQSSSLAAASWKFNVVHLAHLEDGTFPIDDVRNRLAAIQAAGHPVTLIEREGNHWDNPGAWVNGQQVPGTDPDIQTYLFPYLNAGWSAP